MNAYELYKFYRAVKLHFDYKNYDYFKYSGARSGVKIKNYEEANPREKIALERISKLREPKTYITGNMIFGKSTFAGDFSDNHYLQYRKYIVNGNYIFAEEIKNLKQDNFISNFKVASEGDIPYIISLLAQDKISLFTCCVFNKIFNWAEKISPNIIHEQNINMICKSTGFFKIDPEEYKRTIVKQFKR